MCNFFLTPRIFWQHFCTNCLNYFAQISAKLFVCDAEKWGILRKSCSTSCANDTQKFANIKLCQKNCNSTQNLLRIRFFAKGNSQFFFGILHTIFTAKIMFYWPITFCAAWKIFFLCYMIFKRVWHFIDQCFEVMLPTNDLKSCYHVVEKDLQIWTSLAKNVCHIIAFSLLLQAFQKTIICFDRTIVCVLKVKSNMVRFNLP